MTFLWFVYQPFVYLFIYLYIGGLLNFLTWSCIPATLLKMFISYRSSLIEFCGSLMYTIISSANSKSLTSSFPIHIPLITFSCLTALTRSSSTILNRYGESGHPCLIPDFSGIVLSFSLFNLRLAIGLLYIDFVMFRYVPCIPDLSKIFIMKGY